MHMKQATTLMVQGSLKRMKETTTLRLQETPRRKNQTTTLRIQKTLNTMKQAAGPMIQSTPSVHATTVIATCTPTSTRTRTQRAAGRDSGELVSAWKTQTTSGNLVPKRDVLQLQSI